MNLSNFFARRFDNRFWRSGAGGPVAALWSRLLGGLQRALPQACMLCAAPSGNALLCARCNDALPRIEVDPDTFTVRIDGDVWQEQPATELPMAQRYFLF